MGLIFFLFRLTGPEGHTTIDVNNKNASFPLRKREGGREVDGSACSV